MALDATGAPVERAEINLVAVGKGVSSSNGIETLPGGHFVARAVTPGDYAIQVEIGSRYNPEDKRERELGYLPIRVDGGDVEGLVVTTTKLARVAGRIVFEDGTPAGGESIRVTAAMPPATAGRISSGPWPSAEVRPDSTFELTGLFGPQIITVAGQPREWIVKSVTYRGDDITDLPVEFKTSPDPAALEIAMTRRGAIVSGRVLDVAGNGTEAGYVLLISADPARRRSGLGMVTTAEPKTDGAFTLGPVRQGEYVVLAASGEAMMHLSYPDGESLERFVHEGERIILVENEKRSIDLRVVKR